MRSIDRAEELESIFSTKWTGRLCNSWITLKIVMQTQKAKQENQSQLMQKYVIAVPSLDLRSQQQR